eukprot:CAMPEP_0168539476 /NCGR_PEP_ID=MMETSP0405-20121227/21854_1 /TAXON_ID=498012 /ORGANISM="Trichosphaerium sp, Strain Am-I-7 wt" /LENGTH=600 /DNA_ID=CAMNT_0008569053 /DNA_START=397 /DNA_END=2199 /DNA_ORIENTATION=+
MIQNIRDYAVDKDAIMHLYRDGQQTSTSVVMNVEYKPFVAPDSKQKFGDKRPRDHLGFVVDEEYYDSYTSSWEWYFDKRLPQQHNYWNAHFHNHIFCQPNVIVTKQLKGFVREGIPHSFRGELWQLLTGSKKAMKESKDLYKRLLRENMGKITAATKQIDKDVHRTFTEHPILTTKRSEESLRRILIAYSWKNRVVGYCQSMNFLAAFFLLVMSEEEAFWLLCTFVEEVLPSYYDSDLIGSQADLQMFEDMLMTHFPEIQSHLFNLGMPVSLKITSWFLSCYCTILPTETALRIFDWMMVDGVNVLFSIGLALFDINKDVILESVDFETCIGAFNFMTRSAFNADLLVELAFTKYKLKPNEAKKKRQRYLRHVKKKRTQDLKKRTPLDQWEFDALMKEWQKLGCDVISVPQFRDIVTKICPVLENINTALFRVLSKKSDCMNLQEFMMGFSIFTKGTYEQKINLWFDVFDSDCDGYLENKDLVNMFVLLWKLFNHGANMDTAWTSKLFDMVNKRRQGKWTKKEFKLACKHMPLFSEYFSYQIISEDKKQIVRDRRREMTIPIPSKKNPNRKTIRGDSSIAMNFRAKSANPMPRRLYRSEK